MIGLIKNLQNLQIENFTNKICKEIFFGTLSAQKEIEKIFGKFDKKSFSSPLSKAVSIRMGWKLISKDTFGFISGKVLKVEMADDIFSVIRSVCFIEMERIIGDTNNPEDTVNKILQIINDFSDDENKKKKLRNEFLGIYFEDGYTTNEDPLSYSYEGRIYKLIESEEIILRGKIVGLKTISDSAKIINDAARPRVKIKDKVDSKGLIEKENNFIIEIAWLSIVGIANTAKDLFTLFNPSDSAKIFVESAMEILKIKWPNSLATKEYYSDIVKGITFHENEFYIFSPWEAIENDEGVKSLRGRVIESFMDTYREYSALNLESLEIVAKSLSLEIITLGMGRTRKILLDDKDNLNLYEK